MRALVASADWRPRKGYLLSEQEIRSKQAIVGSQVWQSPRFELTDVPIPSPRRDEVLIRVAACGICGSDIHTYETDPEGYIIFSGPARLPSILGHEFSGEVVEVGKDVDGFSKGDIVTSESIMWCGKCLPCRNGMLNQCENVDLMGLTRDGAFAEYISVRADYCWKLNGLQEVFTKKDVYHLGTLIEPFGCAYNGIFISGGGVMPGEYAIVYGAGPIGLGAILLLRLAGAAKIIAVDVIDERLDIARALGADHVLNFNADIPVQDAVLQITAGKGADIQVEAAGAPPTIPLMQKLCAKRGRLIYLGRAQASAAIELNSFVSGAISLVGSRGHSGYGIFSNIIRLLQGGRLGDAKKIITSVLPFSRILDGFVSSASRKDGKILIEIA